VHRGAVSCDTIVALCYSGLTKSADVTAYPAARSNETEVRAGQLTKRCKQTLRAPSCAESTFREPRAPVIGEPLGIHHRDHVAGGRVASNRDRRSTVGAAKRDFSSRLRYGRRARDGAERTGQGELGYDKVSRAIGDERVYRLGVL